jgi:hypothetical protein
MNRNDCAEFRALLPWSTYQCVHTEFGFFRFCSLCSFGTIMYVCVHTDEGLLTSHSRNALPRPFNLTCPTLSSSHSPAFTMRVGGCGWALAVWGITGIMYMYIYIYIYISICHDRSGFVPNRNSDTRQQDKLNGRCHIAVLSSESMRSVNQVFAIVMCRWNDKCR